MPQIAQPPEVRPFNRALRLTFEYEGSNVKLISTQSVEMMLPPTQPLEKHENETGFWFTLSNAQGKPVYRRTIHQPIAYDREVFSNDPKQPSVQRIPIDKPKGTFVMLVPDVPEARIVQLYSHPLTVGGRGQATSEIGRFEISPEQMKGGTK
jgi:hypothetical protein